MPYILDSRKAVDMPKMSFPEEALAFKNEWVAFSGGFKRVVGHGPTTTDALRMAEEAHEEHAFLIFIPEEWPEFLVV